MYVCVSVWMCVCMNVCLGVCMCIKKKKNKMFVHMYECVSVCVYIYI